MAAQAAHLAGLAFIPYYNQIVKVLEADRELRKSVIGEFIIILTGLN